MRLSKTIICVAAVAILSTAAFLALRSIGTGRPPEPTAAGTSQRVPEVANLPDIEPDTEPENLATSVTGPSAETVDLTQERPAVLQTRRMYQAHESLRSAEVNDPESDTNTRIKSEMLGKIFKLSERHQRSLVIPQSNE